MLKLFNRTSEIQATASQSKEKKEDGDKAVNTRLLDTLETNILLCDPKTGIIHYANPKSIETLKKIEHILPIKAEEIIGTCIDVFHKKPLIQRGIIADAANLPHKACIQLADEYLDLSINAVFDNKGTYTTAQLMWDLVTDRERFRQETDQLKQMVELMPINAMMCDPNSLEIIYMNKASKRTLKSLQQHLPVQVDNIMGQCIDVFHKNPEHQRRILKDPTNLPWKARIKLGPETLVLNINAITDSGGTYIGALTTWSVVTHEEQISNTVSQSVTDVSNEVKTLENQATSLASNAEQNIGLAEQVTHSSREATNNVQAVASATEEMAASISEISSQVSHASKISDKASRRVSQANGEAEELSISSAKISEVVRLINDIADQTNLLALNATIEAARAGEAGKGFAVVASEVKSLANQTAQATEDISRQVDAIQGQTKGVVNAISEIGTIIEEVSEIATAISASTDEQGAATQEISRSVDEAANRTRDVANQMDEVKSSSEQTAQSANMVNQASASLAQLAHNLQEEVSQLSKTD